MQIKHTTEAIELSQHQCITNILSPIEMENCRPASTLRDSTASLLEASHFDHVFEQN